MRAERWEQIAGLFEELTTVPPEQRIDFIRERCGDDAELRAELESLLSVHESAGPLDAAPTFVANDADIEARTEAGTSVGPYRLLRPIGEGGMGSVWLAERADGALKRTVALKRPHVSWVGTLAERMAQERDILASLEHPNIARLYDAGVTVDGRPYLALEYVEGQPITRYCDSKQLPVAERLRLFLQVLDAVRYAHAHLVIHRDIKPSNILVSADGRVHLLDFGIAKLLRQDVEHDARTQWDGAVTPDYASPEQIAGRVVSTASDVYSLGVLLCELLAGARPYQLRRDSRGALEDAILEAEPRAPSRIQQPGAAQSRGVGDRALVRALSGDLDNIVLKALRKDPAERYGNVDLLAQDISRHLNGEAILAQRGSAGYYAGKFLRRHKLAVASAATVVIALFVGAGLALWQAREARNEAARAEQVKSFALAMLDSADTDSGAGTGTTAVDLLQAARKRVEAELAGRPAIAAELMTAIAYGLLGQDRSQDAADLLEKAIALSSQANGPDHEATIYAQVVYGEALYTSGKNDEAIALLKPTAERAHRLHQVRSDVDAHRWLSGALLDAGEHEAAAESARAAVAALPAVVGEDRRAIQQAMEAHQSLGNVYLNLSDPRLIGEARATLELVEKLPGGRGSVSGVQARVAFGQGLLLDGQVAPGLAELKSAYSDLRALLGDEHIQTEVIANLYGNACVEGGEPAEALMAQQASFDSIQRHAAERGPFVMAMGHYGVAAAANAARENERALTHYENAAKFFEQVGGPNAPLALRSRSARASVLVRLGRLDAAEQAFESLASTAIAGPDKFLTDGRISVLRSLQGRHEEAIALARSSAEGLKDIRSKSGRAQAQARIGSALLAAHQNAAAVPELERAVQLFQVAQSGMSPDHAEAVEQLNRARAGAGAAAN